MAVLNPTMPGLKTNKDGSMNIEGTIKSLFTYTVDQKDLLEWLFRHLDGDNILDSSVSFDKLSGGSIDLTGAVTIFGDKLTTILDQFGLDTRFIKWGKNFAKNSSFEIFDTTSNLPKYWDGGVSTADSNFFGAYSMQLAIGESSTSSFIANPQWWNSISKFTRISFHKKLGATKIYVYDQDDNLLTIKNQVGNSGTSLEFEYNENWVAESYSVQLTHGDATNLKVKFENTDGTYTSQIDGLIIEADYTRKRPSFYSDGPDSAGSSIGLSITTEGHVQKHDIDSSSDHNVSSVADKGKYARANESTGAIEFSDVNSDDVVEGTTNLFTTAEEQTLWTSKPNIAFLVCMTAAGTAAKEASTMATPYVPVDGDIVAIMFASGTAVDNPTISIEGGDPLPILFHSADPLIGKDLYLPSNGGVATFIYKNEGSEMLVLLNPYNYITDTDDIVEGNNKFVTAADITNLGNLSGENTGDQTKITDILTLDATAISNKYIDLTHVPLDATAVGLFPIGGIKQLYTIDFTVITDGADIKRLNWDGLGLETLLADGDIISSDYIY